MSYYVTLPSNGADLKSDYGKANNTLTDFEIELKQPLDFPLGNYEVALAEISYRKTWTFNLGWFTVMTNTHEDMKHETVFTEKLIDVLDGMTTKQIIYRINNVIQNYDNQKNVGLLNTSLQEKPVLMINDRGKFEIFVPLGLKLVIDGYFGNLLYNKKPKSSFYKVNVSDKERDRYIHENVKFESHKRLIIAGHDKLKASFKFPNKRINYIENLFLYTDIINEVHVGSQMLKLLKVIPDKAIYDEMVSETFIFPHYVELDSRFIDRIRLYLCDSEGNKIKFTDQHSRVIYKLHFRQKK